VATTNIQTSKHSKTEFTEGEGSREGRGGRPRSAAMAGPCCCRQGAGSLEAVGEVPTWTRRRWRLRGVEAGMEEEQACGGGGVG
jgi:hypothetical protein